VGYILVPFAPIEIVDGPDFGVEQRESRNCLIRNTHRFELGGELVAVHPHHACAFERVLQPAIGERARDAVARRAVGRGNPHQELGAVAPGDAHLTAEFSGERVDAGADVDQLDLTDAAAARGGVRRSVQGLT
jgi:hypothetical protein